MSVGKGIGGERVWKGDRLTEPAEMLGQMRAIGSNSAEFDNREDSVRILGSRFHDKGNGHQIGPNRCKYLASAGESSFGGEERLAVRW